MLTPGCLDELVDVPLRVRVQRHGLQSISALAFAVGYESESAVSTAFRRVVGSSPKQFRQQAMDPSPRLQ